MRRYSSLLQVAWVLLLPYFDVVHCDSETTQQTSSNAGGSPFGVVDNTLVFSEPLVARNGFASLNAQGYLAKFLPNDPPSLKTISLDVGVNRGRVIIGDWLSVVPHMYVIGVEANHHLTAHFEYSDATKAYRDRAIVIPAAVSTKRGTATFNTGGGWQNNMSDVGSLFGWEDPRREAERKKLRDLQQTVRLIALSDILVHVAPPVPPLFMWDTFKVDIQGSDVEALITAEGYLKNFVCVVGEFQSNHYKIPDGVAQDPAPILTAADFVKVYHKDNQIWMNKRYSKEYLANPELFGCHRVYDSKVEAAVLAKEFTRLIA
eukprot:gene26629-32179_t